MGGMRKVFVLGGCFIVLLGLSGCGIFGGKKAVPPGGSVKDLIFVLSAGDTLNNCGKGPSNALGVRVYQLSADTRMAGLPQSTLWEDDATGLGEELLAKQEWRTRWVAVVGNFCKSEGECWKWLGAADQLKSKTVFHFGAVCIKERP
jgi:predicted component of type VI protein secretion system